MFELMNELARRMEARTALFPALNVWEEADRFVLVAELPGVKPEALDVSVVDGRLVIKGSRPTAVSEAGSYLCRERVSGDFLRSVELPGGVDAAAVEAELRDGLLTIALPKAEAAKPRRITVRNA